MDRPRRGIGDGRRLAGNKKWKIGSDFQVVGEMAIFHQLVCGLVSTSPDRKFARFDPASLQACPPYAHGASELNPQGKLPNARSSVVATPVGNNLAEAIAIQIRFWIVPIGVVRKVGEAALEA